MVLAYACTWHRRPTDRVRAGVVESQDVSTSDVDMFGRRESNLVKSKFSQSHERLTDQLVRSEVVVVSC